MVFYKLQPIPNMQTKFQQNPISIMQNIVKIKWSYNSCEKGAECSFFRFFFFFFSFHFSKLDAKYKTKNGLSVLRKSFKVKNVILMFTG